MFGWYHPSGREVCRGNVLLCSPFGHEAMATHRGHVNMARRFAEAGFAVLRFDYDGTGNSAGDAHDPNRVQAWLASIRHARAALAELSGAAISIVFGTRFGALLALREALDDAADALILLAPPASGRGLVREMQAIHALRQSQRRLVPTRPELAIVGFPLDEEARAELSKIDFRQLERAPSRHALIIPRDDVPNNEARLVERLRASGTDATLLEERGYAAFVQDDPVKSETPERIIEAALAWLDRTFPLETNRRQLTRSELRDAASGPRLNRDSEIRATEHPTSPRPGSAFCIPGGNFREEAVHFGGIFGVLTSPVAVTLAEPTAIALLNIGANHHVGSNRLYVSMARAWAALGFHVLRLDFPGIGDSPVALGRREKDVYSAHLIGDTRSAIDFLQARGAERFVLVGLCSGAYAAYHAAVADPRVSDVVLINLLTFHWTEGDSLEVRSRRSAKSTRFYKRAIWRAETWKRFIKGEVNVRRIASELGRRVQSRFQREAGNWLARLGRATTEVSDIERGFRQLDERGTGCLAIYGSNDGGIDVIEEHLGPGASAMRKSRAFRMVVLDGPDHTFTPLWTQSHLIELIGKHLLDRSQSGRSRRQSA